MIRVPLSFLPIPLLVVLVGVVYFAVDPSLFFEPAWLLPITNTLFITVVCFAVAWIAMRNYQATGRIQFLLLGCGLLPFGIGGATAAFLRAIPGGANLNVTVYNTGALLGGLFHFAAALTLLAGVSPELGAKRKGFWLFFGYAGVSLFMGLLALASFKGVIPPFFVQRVGPTLLRQRIVGDAALLFAFSFVMFLAAYVRNKEVFLYWYSCALALTSISLGAFFIERSVGGPVGWVGRLSQYLGGVYFLIALITAVRSAHARRISLGQILAASLSPAEEKFRALAENSPDVIIRLDRELRHVYVNPAGLRLYGCSAGAIVGRSIEQAGLPEACGSLWKQNVQAVFRTGEAARAEGYLPASGGAVFFQSQCVAEYGADGTVAHVLVIARDLTERRRVEREREITIEFLRLVNQADGLHPLIETAVRFFQEQSGCEAAGIRLREGDDYPYYEARGFPAEFVAAESSLCSRCAGGEVERDHCGNPVLACMCGNVIRGRFDPAKPFFTAAGSFWTNSTSQLLASTSEADRQARTRNRCNGEGYESVALVPLRIGEQRIGLLQLNDRHKDRFSPPGIALWERLAGYLAVALASATAQGALAVSEQRFRLLVEQTVDGIFVSDAQGHYIDVNSAGCEMLGYGREEILARSIADVIAVEEVPRLAPEVARFAGGRVVRSEWRFRRKDGSFFVGEVVGRRLPDGRLQAILRDISERKRAEEALVAAKAALEQAAAAKDAFIAKLSHELRTPLTPVVASLSVLARDARLPEDLREDMRLIERNIGLEVHLINDLLDVTRIVNGKLELRKEPMDVAAALKEAGRIVADDLDARGQTLIIDAPGAPYWVDADRARLHQVLWNLLKNAIKFSPERGRIIVQASAGDGRVRIAVKDAGQGIDPADLPRLFNAFEQGGAGQGFGGLGLGLAICKGVVEMHGGGIEAHSEGKGRGATFAITLPLLAVAPAAAPSAPSAELAAAAGPLRILLVEDHEDSARVMGRLLRAEDHQVTLAGCVKDALAAAESGAFDVLVSDLGLPDGSGYDLMRQLRATGKKLKAIAVSGYGTAEDVRRALDAGFAEHVTKPISFDALHDALVRIAYGHNIIRED